MMKCQPPAKLTVPKLWLVSDARNDAALDKALARLPRGCGLIFRHYHLDPAARRLRFAACARAARARGAVVVLAGPMAQARGWGADGAYGPPGLLARGGPGLRLITAHNLRDIASAMRARADAVLLSPAYPTRSHPGATALGLVRWRLLAARGRVPVIALGGMNARKARALQCLHWAAIDAFGGSSPADCPGDS